MKKITVVGPLPPWKGVSQYVKGFVQALGQHTEVQVFDFKSMYPKRLYPGGDPKQDGVEIPTCQGVISHQILSWWNPFSWISAGLKIDGAILHMQYWIRFLSPIYIIVGLLARYIKRIPVIITVHNAQPHEISAWKIWLDSLVYKTANKLIVHSEANKAQLKNIVGDAKEISIFPHGIIMPEVQKIEKIQARKQLNILGGKKTILFFGIIRPYKGLHIALDSLAQLVQKNPDYHMIIAGKCRGDRQEYQDKIDELSLHQNITRVEGFLDDSQLSQVFSASDLMILPYTHFDAQSGVVALGLGFELPMIVSKLGGLTEVIDKEAYIFGVNNLDALNKAILDIDINEAKRYIQNKSLQYSRDNIVSDLLMRY